MSDPITSNAAYVQLKASYDAQIQSLETPNSVKIADLKNQLASLRNTDYMHGGAKPYIDMILNGQCDKTWAIATYPGVAKYFELAEDLMETNPNGTVGTQDDINAKIKERDAALADMASSLQAQNAGLDAMTKIKAAQQSNELNFKDGDVMSLMVQVFGGVHLAETDLAKTEMESVSDRTTRMESLNTLMQTVRTSRPTGTNDPEAKLSAQVYNALKDAGVKLPDGNLSADGKTYTLKQSDFDTMLSNAQGTLDSLNSQNNMQQTDLQRITDALKEADTMQTQVLSTQDRLLSDIIKNTG